MKHLFITITALAAISAPQSLVAAEIQTPTAGDVVLTLPSDATEKTYLREATLFRQWGEGAIKNEPVTGRLSTIAETPDGKVYISDAIYSGTKGYLVGTRTGNQVTFSFPQVLQQGETFVTVMRLEPGTIEIPGETLADPTKYYPTYNIVADSQKITFTVENGKFVQEPETYMGFVNTDGKWNGYGEFDQSFTLFDATLVEVPEDAESFNVALKYLGSLDMQGESFIYRLLPACKKDNTVYIQGFSTTYPESWIKGTVEGDRLTFENGQLLGIGTSRSEYFCTGIDTPEWNPGYQVWEHNYSLTKQLVLGYDAATGTITALDSNDMISVNSSSEIFNNGTVYRNPTLTPQPKAVDPTPMLPVFNPAVNQWENGISPYLTFQILPLNTKGQLLDKEKMGFAIYTEGKLYTFSEWDYWIDEDMTIVPWGFSASDFYMLPNGFTQIWFQDIYYVRDLAIKAVYTIDGKEYYSAPQYPDKPVSVDAVSESASPVISTRYIDLQGNIIDKAEKGIYIIESIHEDGTVTYRKNIF